MSGKFLHPHGGKFSPGDKTTVKIHAGHHYATLWSINTASKNIMHVGGKFFHPKGGNVRPGDDTPVVIYGGTHEATQFTPVDANDRLFKINGAILAGGRWERIFAVIDSKISQTRTVTTMVGMSKTTT